MTTNCLQWVKCSIIGHCIYSNVFIQNENWLFFFFDFTDEETHAGSIQ